jgi:Protein of unknown function (DUF4197)
MKRTDQAQTHLTRRSAIYSALLLTGVSASAGLFVPSSAIAQLIDADATNGIRAAMERGSIAAIGKLGAADGFWGNGKVRIPLPEPLHSARKAATLLGLDGQFKELEMSINRAAEKAVPQAKDLLVDSVKRMSVKDAMGIVKGGETSVTDYFRKATGAQILERFKPIIASTVTTGGVRAKYEALASKGVELGLIKSKNANFDNYVTGKAVDGLFYMIAEEEKSIRKNPLATGSAILKKVFGK